MRLGFWNRLAIVATGLAMLAAPTVIVISQNNETTKLREINYQFCVKASKSDYERSGNLEIYDEALRTCGRLQEQVTFLGWDAWWAAVGGTLIVCLIIYALIFAALAIGRWVWRGLPQKA